MLRNTNNWIGEGYISTDLLLRHTTDSNRSVCNFFLVVENTYKSKKNVGEEQFLIKKRIEKIPVTAWSNLAEKICETFKKDDKVKINGAIRTKVVKDKHNVMHTTFEIILNECELISRKTE